MDISQWSDEVEEISQQYAERFGVQAITSGGLTRGLLRIPGLDGSLTTVDAVAVPLR